MRLKISENVWFKNFFIKKSLYLSNESENDEMVHLKRIFNTTFLLRERTGFSSLVE